MGIERKLSNSMNSTKIFLTTATVLTALYSPVSSYAAEQKYPLAPKPGTEQTQRPGIDYVPRDYTKEPDKKQENPKNKKTKSREFFEKVGAFIALFGAFQKIQPLEKALDINIDYSVRKMTPEEQAKYKQEQKHQEQNKGKYQPNPSKTHNPSPSPPQPYQR